MSPRIIAGQARGRRIQTPPGASTRPTSDRVREALFSILTPQLAGARFLDLFAGSGANGLEALSRGADSATFIDNDTRCLGIVRKNARELGLLKRVHAVKMNLPGGLDGLRSPEGGFSVVVADPPYRFTAYPQLLEKLAASGALATAAIIVVEHASRASMPDSAGPLNRYRQAAYGETTLSFFA